MLRRVNIFIEGNRVPVSHSGDAVYVLDQDGNEWICKKEFYTGWEALLAEAIGWMLGGQMAVPLPDAAWDRGGDGLRWLSRRIEGVTHWGDKAPDARIANPEGLGATIALDAILWNQDRHQGNILLQPQDDTGTSLKAFAIDMDHAQVGWVPDFANHGTNVPGIATNHARDLPLAAMAQAAATSAAQAASLSRSYIDAVCEEACNLVQENRVVTLAEALYRRCQAAPDMIHQYLVKLGGRP